MPFCQSCGKTVNADARFCNGCGKPANLRYAPNPAIVAASGAVALPIETYSAVPNIKLAQTPAPVVMGARSNDSASRVHRPRGVTILAVLAFLVIIPTIILGVILMGYAASASAEGSVRLAQLLMRLFPMLAQGQYDMVNQASASAIVTFIIAAFFAVVSYGLWRLRKWGRVVAIAFSALSALRAAAMIFISPGGVIWQLIVIGINIWIVMYLLKPHVKQAFGARPA